MRKPSMKRKVDQIQTEKKANWKFGPSYEQTIPVHVFPSQTRGFDNWCAMSARLEGAKVRRGKREARIEKYINKYEKFESTT